MPAGADVRVEDYIRQTAKAAGVPPELALAVAEHESGLNPTAIGPAIPSMPGVRARGTFQLLPETAKGLGVDPDDPAQNIVGGVRYLRQLLDQHQGDLNAVLKTYGGFVNADPTNYQTDIYRRIEKFRQPATAAAGQAGVPAAGRASGAGPSGAAGAPGAPQGRTSGPGPGPAPSAISAEMGTPEAFVKSLAAPFDPRTPEGRQNLAATAGATALTAGVTYLTGGVGAGIVPWIARILAGPAGAMVGGMTAEKGEQMAGTKPAIPGEAAYQGTVQGAYELAGQTFLWPIRRLLRGFVAPRVERQARTALESGVTEAVESRTAVTTAARERVRQGVSEAKELARSTVEATREAGRVALRDTKQATAAKLAQLELDNTATLKAVTEQYDNLLAQAAPSIGGAAAATRATLEGPAKRALDAAGQRVAEAAAQGPAITMQPVKDALNEIASKFRPDAIFGQTDEAAAKAIGFQIPEAARASVAAQLGASDSTSKAIAQALGVSADHPLPGLLGKVQNAPETITFADAHKLKMLLDESVNWDRVAKRHLEKITKGLRQVLREQLSAFEPYNVAAAAYQAVIPLYRRGVGKAVTRAATENPDLIARVLDPRKPAQALALRSLLIDQAAAGGDVRIGQEAWDHVRSAMVHDRLLKGGIEGMKDRMTAMLTNYPEFVRVVFNDHTALKVLSNLDHMAEAYTTAVGTGTAKIAATKASGKSAEQIVRDTAAEAIRASRVEGRAGVAGAETAGRAEMDIVRKAASAGVKAARDAQEQLRASSLRGGTVTGQMAEAARALILGPKGSLWGTLSLIRLMHGPQAADLLQYVSHSDKLTQHYVQVLLGQAPDRIVSDVIRDAVGVLSPPTPPAPAAKESPRAPVQPRGTNEPTEPAAVAQ